MKYVSLLSIFFVVAFAAPARADTEEHKAVEAAAHRAQYERARFICLSRGASMQPYEQVEPAVVISSQAQLKAKYPEFWALGTTQGAREADEHMRYVNADILERQCAYMQSQLVKLTPDP